MKMIMVELLEQWSQGSKSTNELLAKQAKPMEDFDHFDETLKEDMWYRSMVSFQPCNPFAGTVNIKH